MMRALLALAPEQRPRHAARGADQPGRPAPRLRPAELAGHALFLFCSGGFMIDHAEALTNAVVGLAVSWALVAILRAVGAWDAPAWAISAVFFVASVARSYGLRRAFRAWEGRR